MEVNIFSNYKIIQIWLLILLFSILSQLNLTSQGQGIFNYAQTQANSTDRFKKFQILTEMFVQYFLNNELNCRKLWIQSPLKNCDVELKGLEQFEFI